MVANFKSMMPRNFSGHDLVDAAARSNEPLNRSVETCSGLTQCSRGSFGLAYTSIYVYSPTIFLYMIFPFLSAINE